MAMKRMICLLLFFLCFLSVLSVSAAQNVVSLHKGYELITKASAGYPDEENELTNGRYGTPVENGDKSYYYRDTEYVGFNRGDANSDGNFVVILDLAEEYTELSDFEVGYLIETDVGIFAPQKVAFYISDARDGDFAMIGEVSLSGTTAAGQQKAGIATVTAADTVSGRYVMCVITPQGAYTDEDGTDRTATWTFIDEITVLQGKNPISEAPSSDDGSVNNDTPSDASRSQSQSSSSEPSPAAGDKGILSLVFLGGASALGAAALIGRRRRKL